MKGITFSVLQKGVFVLMIGSMGLLPLSAYAEHTPQHLEETDDNVKKLFGIAIVVGLIALIVSNSKSEGGNQELKASQKDIVNIENDMGYKVKPIFSLSPLSNIDSTKNSSSDKYETWVGLTVDF